MMLRRSPDTSNVQALLRRRVEKCSIAGDQHEVWPSHGKTARAERGATMIRGTTAEVPKL
jgi:hypothetical protein